MTVYYFSNVVNGHTLNMGFRVSGSIDELDDRLFHILGFQVTNRIES